MQKLNFKPLFDYLDEKFEKINNEFTDVKERISTLTNAVDTAIKQGKDNREEIIPLNYQVKEHDKRLTKVEKKLGISYHH